MGRAEQTKDRIDGLFPPGATADTAMVVVNAIAMDAPWIFPFDPSSTVPGPFTRPDGTTVDVPMMHYEEYLPSATSDTYQAIELPYGGGALSMVVIVPNDLAAFEATLTGESLAAVVGSIADGGIHLTLPCGRRAPIPTLNDSLAWMGMPTAFSENGGLLRDGRGGRSVARSSRARGVHRRR